MTNRKSDDYYFDHGTYGNRRSKEIAAAIQADPSNRQLRKDLEHVESCREQAYEERRQQWLREQEREEADRWLEEMAGSPGFELY